MREKAGKPTARTEGCEGEPWATLTQALRAHCEHKRGYFAWRWPANDDADLRRIISDHPADAKPASATPCLRRKRAQLRPHLGRRPPLRETMARSQYLCLRAAETLW